MLFLVLVNGKNTRLIVLVLQIQEISNEFFDSYKTQSRVSAKKHLLLTLFVHLRAGVDFFLETSGLIPLH